MNSPANVETAPSTTRSDVSNKAKVLSKQFERNYS